MARTAARLMGIVALAVLLSGCLKATQELTLNPDDTVDGTAVFAVNKSFLDMAGVSADEFMDQITQGEGPLPQGVEFETAPYEDDEFIGSEYTFEGAPLSAFNDPGGGDLAITREGDAFVVSGTLDATSEELDPTTTPGAEQILESFDVRISVTFPGEIESANGEIDGNTVTWTPALGETTELSARGSAIASGGGGSLPLILIGVTVVVVIVVLLVVIAGRRRSRPAEPSGVEGAPPAAPTADLVAPAAPVAEPAPPAPPVTEEVPPPPPASTERVDPAD
jgi:hypothetical protein